MGVQSGLTQTGTVQWCASIVRARGKPARIDQLMRRQTEPGGHMTRYMLLDCSSSMLRHAQLGYAKAWVLANHRASASQVSGAFLVSARGNDFESTRCASNASAFQQQLNDLPAGGGTSISAAFHWIVNAQRPQNAVELWLVSDGRFELDIVDLPAAMSVVCVDCELGPVRLDRMERHARNLGAVYLSLNDSLTLDNQQSAEDRP